MEIELFEIRNSKHELLFKIETMPGTPGCWYAEKSIWITDTSYCHFATVYINNKVHSLKANWLGIRA